MSEDTKIITVEIDFNAIHMTAMAKVFRQWRREWLFEDGIYDKFSTLNQYYEYVCNERYGIKIMAFSNHFQNRGDTILLRCSEDDYLKLCVCMT